jgi:Glycosyltransferase family 10 (fucosyltransferase) C-term
MTLVRIIKDWDWPNLFQQTPGCSGVWNEIQFTETAVSSCDFLIICNHVTHKVELTCPPENIWAIVQEPPVSDYVWLEKGFRNFERVYTPDISLNGPRYHPSHGALPWHINKTYDELKHGAMPEKRRILSSVTSNKTDWAGHQDRLSFLRSVQAEMDLDLWGRGIQSIADKWDGIAPYKYSIAIENCSAPYYWTEKLSDCLLSWTMPIYYGATNIFNFFPRESILWVNITHPEEAIESIQQAIADDLWSRNLDAIAHARELVLEKYQFFPFMSEKILEIQRTRESPIQYRKVTLPALIPPYAAVPKESLSRRLLAFARRVARKLKRKGHE